jgi:hypothetical protein
MKPNLLFGLLAFLVLCPVAARADEAKPVDRISLARSIKDLTGKHDTMRGITWYKHAAAPKYDNTNTFYLYFGITDDQMLTPLRLKITYSSDSWLFVQSVWGKADGKKIDLPQVSETIMGWERDNSGGKIWEWSDASVETAAEIAAVRQISTSKQTIVRFEGRQYYGDRTLTAAQLLALRETISAYQLISAKPWQ